eukprot:256314-Rhodomonas_salina.1
MCIRDSTKTALLYLPPLGLLSTRIKAQTSKLTLLVSELGSKAYGLVSKVLVLSPPGFSAEPSGLILLVSG